MSIQLTTSLDSCNFCE